MVDSTSLGVIEARLSDVGLVLPAKLCEKSESSLSEAEKLIVCSEVLTVRWPREFRDFSFIYEIYNFIFARLTSTELNTGRKQ